MKTVNISYKNYKKGVLLEPDVFTRLIEENGNAFTLKLLNLKFPIFADPEYVNYALNQNPRNYIRNFKAIGYLNRVWGDYGLVTVQDYDQWKKNREEIGHFFHSQKMKDNFEAMVQTLTRVLDSCEPLSISNTSINVDTFFTDIATKNLVAALFPGIAYKRDVAYKAEESIPSLGSKLLYLANPFVYHLRVKLFGMIPIPPLYCRFQKYKKEVDEYIYGIINQSMKAEIPEDNFIKKIMKSRGIEKVEQLNDKTKEYLRSEVFTFFIVGQETTAAALGYAFLFLSLYPQVAKKVKEEVESVIGARNPTYDDIEKLNYTLAVVKETLRIQPPVVTITRCAVKDELVFNYPIKQGDLVHFPIFSMHRLSKYWENPEGFDPNRFLQPLSREQQYLYMPFAQGERNCIGQNFSMLEMTLVLAMFMQRYRLELDPGCSLERKATSLINRLNEKVTMKIYKQD